MPTVDGIATAQQAHQFLSDLFAYVPAELYCYLWMLGSKRSFWFHPNQLEQMAARAVQEARDVYVGVSISPQDFGFSKRCESAMSAGLPGFYADVDVAGSGHKKKALPETFEDAYWLCDSILKPTLIVHSGHGLQPWWLFKEPWIFSSDRDRENAMVLLQRWQEMLRQKARSRGWTLDATHDLARVLRVPGTLNAKDREHIVPVTIVRRDNEVRYEAGDFPVVVGEEFDRLVSPIQNGIHIELEKASIGPIVVMANAEPPLEKLNTLLEDEDALKAFHRKYKDLDMSASKQDWHLARIAGEKGGWTPQEIVNLLVYCRRKNGDDLKLNHKSYYQLTVSRALLAAAANVESRRLMEETNQMMSGAEAIKSLICEEPLSIAKPQSSAASASPQPIPEGGYTFDPEGGPPPIKWTQIWEDKRFRNMWNADIPIGSTPRARNINIAKFAFSAGWSEKDCSGLLSMYNREIRKTPESEETIREIILIARGAVKEENEEREYNDRMREYTTTDIYAAAIEKHRKTIEPLVGLDDIRIFKIAAAPDPRYRLECSRGTVFFQTVGEILNYGQFNKKIAGLANRQIKASPKQWRKIADGILRLVEDDDGAHDAEPTQEMRSIIAAFLLSKGKLSQFDEWKDSMQMHKTEKPFIAAGRVWFKFDGPEGIMTYLIPRGKNTNAGDLSNRLRSAGFRSDKKGWRDGDKTISARYWSIEQSLMSEHCS